MTLLHLTPREAPALVETAAARPGVRGLAFDAKTHALWTVSSDPEAGDLLLELTAAPKPTAGGSDTAHNSGQSL